MDVRNNSRVWMEYYPITLNTSLKSHVSTTVVVKKKLTLCFCHMDRRTVAWASVKRKLNATDKNMAIVFMAGEKRS